MPNLEEYKENYQNKLRGFEEKLNAIALELSESLEQIKGASDDIEALNQAVIELAEIIGGE